MLSASMPISRLSDTEISTDRMRDSIYLHVCRIKLEGLGRIGDGISVSLHFDVSLFKHPVLAYFFLCQGSDPSTHLSSVAEKRRLLVILINGLGVEIDRSRPIMLSKCGVAFDLQGIRSLGDGGGHFDGGIRVARIRRPSRRKASTARCVENERPCLRKQGTRRKVKEAQDQVLMARGL